MGRKVHPVGFRIGVIRDWQAKWYADKHYSEFIQEDVKIRKAIRQKYAEAGVSLVEIERQANRVSITINTARPGIVIGRGGQRVDETRHYLEALIGKKIQLNIQEIRQPELDAYLVARNVAEQMERRIAYRRAMKQAIFRTMQAGAQGMRINCAGRLGGVEIARRQMMHQGRVPLHTLRADIDYGFTEAHTTLGRIGIKVWIYRGDILPEVEQKAVEEIPAEHVAETAAEAKPVAVKVEKEEARAKVAEKAAAAPAADEKAAKPKAKKAAARKPAAAAVVEEVKAPTVAEKEAKPKAKRVTKKKADAKAEEAVAEVIEKAEPKAKKAKPKKEEEKAAKAKAKKKAETGTAEAEETKKKATARKTIKTRKAAKAEEIEAEKTDATTEKG
jgi:small subunit ribosomal protein S3